MSAITNIIGAIASLLGKLIGSIFGLLGGIFSIFSKGKGKTDGAKASKVKGQKKKKGYYLAVDDGKEGSAPAKSVIPDAQGAAASAQPAETSGQSSTAAPISVNEALNLPEPEVATIEPLDIPKFGPARRPGSNMKAFLDMAKTVKT